MPKLIVNDNRLFGRENGLNLEIDGKSNKLSLDGRQELELEYGEHNLRIFELFFMMKSRDVKLDVTSNEVEVDLNYNFVILFMILLLNLSIFLLVLLKLENFLLFYIVFVLLIDSIFMIFVGIFKIKIKE